MDTDFNLLLNQDTSHDLDNFKTNAEKEGYLWENYNEDIFNEYHTDLVARGNFILDISYKEWLVYKILLARYLNDIDNYNKYAYEHYIIYED